MAADYRINLAKELTSSLEMRQRFYNGMHLYLGLCCALLVLVGYLSTVNVISWMSNRNERRELLASASRMTGIDSAGFKDPDKLYRGLNAYSGQLASLRRSLARRPQLLPIIHNLFLDLPESVTLQSLSAGDGKLLFGLVMPPASEEGGDPVRELRTAWEGNKELMKRVVSIRPLTGERQTTGTKSLFYVKFECILNK
jgi:hypothetical protein